MLLNQNHIWKSQEEGSILRASQNYFANGGQMGKISKKRNVLKHKWYLKRKCRTKTGFLYQKEVGGENCIKFKGSTLDFDIRISKKEWTTSSWEKIVEKRASTSQGFPYVGKASTLDFIFFFFLGRASTCVAWLCGPHVMLVILVVYEIIWMQYILSIKINVGQQSQEFGLGWAPIASYVK